MLGDDDRQRLLLAAEQQRATGAAKALPAQPQTGQVGMPEMLAAGLVAVVGGLLARTWAGRGSAST